MAGVDDAVPLELVLFCLGGCFGDDEIDHFAKASPNSIRGIPPSRPLK